MCSCLKDTSGSGATLDEMGFLGSLFFLFLLLPPSFFVYWEGSCIKGRASRWDMETDLPTGVLGRNFFSLSFYPAVEKDFD